MQKTDIRKLLKDPSLFREEAFINGQWFKAASGKTFPVNNPATEEIIAEVSNLNAADAQLAIDVAAQALPGWRSKTGKERAGIMRKWFDLILSLIHISEPTRPY